MRHFISTGIFLLLASFTFSQNVFIGTVKDATTNRPLSFVEVYWVGNKDIGKRTDKNGVYRIPKKPGVNSLVFEYGGKKKQFVTVEENGALEVDVLMYDEGATSVTASRWEQSVYEIPASTVVIDREEIEQNGYISLQEILENVPGLFTIDHRSESDVTLGIRGFWAPFNRNVMIQVNGVTMLNERQNDFPLNKINVSVESIDKIEIVRGPMSVIYGAGAFFGVINIITNETKEGSSGRFITGFGTQGLQKNTIGFNAQDKGFKISFNAMTFRRNGFSENWDEMVNDSIYDQDSARLIEGFPNSVTISDYRGLAINPERYSKKHQAFNFSAGYKGFFANLNFATSDFGFSFIEPGPGRRNDYRSTTGNYQAGFRKSLFNNRFDFEIKGGFLNSDVDVYYKFFSDSAYTTGRDIISSIRTELNTRTIILDSEQKNNIDLDLISGISWNVNLENGSFYNQPEQKLRNWYVGLHPDAGGTVQTTAGYTQFDLKWNIREGSTLSMIAGGRLEKEGQYRMLSDRNPDYIFETQDSINGIPVIDTLFPNERVDSVKPSNGINPIPRLALIYKSTNDRGSRHHVKMMYGEAIKQGTVVDNANDILVPNVRDTANLNYLRPERIQTFEFGYTYVNDSLGIELNTNLFSNHLDSLITRETEINEEKEYIAFSKNGGAFQTYGIEFIFRQTALIQVKGEKKLNLVTNISATYQATRDQNQNQTDGLVSFSPPWLATAHVLGSYSLPKCTIRFGLGANYVGSMRSFFAPASGTEANPEPAHFIGAETKGYTRFSVNFRILGIRFFNEQKGGGFVNLKSSNLLNKKYYYPTYSINPWADKGMLGRGRQIFLSVGYTF